jgi:hypothetical protein
LPLYLVSPRLQPVPDGGDEKRLAFRPNFNRKPAPWTLKHFLARTATFPEAGVYQ